MMERLKIPFPIIVEGRYDVLRLQQVVDGQILTTDGFRLFNHEEKIKLFRALSKKTPLILLTDSDGAGKLIRSHITSMIPPERLIHLFIPRIVGKEKRKSVPSAEGTLGVEGMDASLLYELLSPYADAEAVNLRLSQNPLSKADFYMDGLTGGEGSREKRDALAVRLGLPAGMTPNSLLAALRVLLTYEEYCICVGRMPQK